MIYPQKLILLFTKMCIMIICSTLLLTKLYKKLDICGSTILYVSVKVQVWLIYPCACDVISWCDKTIMMLYTMPCVLHITLKISKKITYKPLQRHFDVLSNMHMAVAVWHITRWQIFVAILVTCDPFKDILCVYNLSPV